MKQPDFFAELKRRNVYKVAVAYSVVAWLLVQAASIFFPTYEAPPWVMKVFIAIVIAGFPIALVLAWAFELTPEGIQRSDAITPQAGRSRSRLWIVVIALAVMASAALFFVQARKPVSEPDLAKSIAVLPFESLSDDKANAYFADGMQEEILARLAKVTDLKVISRTSTQKYKGAPVNLREIAQQLGVSNVLEGSVQKETDQVRVTVQLINATNDAHLWAETYDRKLIDTFQVESDIAQKIASTLEAKLTGREKAAIEQATTTDAAAYDAYLHALALRNTQTEADRLRYRDYLREAVRLDPKFAAAWAELAVAESSRFFFPEESEPQKERARIAAETALRLAPDSSDAQGATGLYYYYVEKNYDEALRWLDRARAIAPNDWKVIFATALVKRRQGKLDETIALQKRAAELDPLNVDIWTNLGRSYRGRRDLAEARKMFERALAISPNDMELIVTKAETFLAGGDIDTAWNMVRDLKPPPSEHQAFSFVVNLLAFRGDVQAAMEMVSRALQPDAPPLTAAKAHFGLAMGYRQMGNAAAAQPLFAQAEKELSALHEKHEGGILVVEILSRIRAVAGDREAVERLDAECARMRGKDQWANAYLDEQAGINYAIMGDADRAVPHLERALHAVCAEALTPAYLRIDSVYDPIRKDPRFQKLASEKL